jgi:hypothetical protein
VPFVAPVPQPLKRIVRGNKMGIFFMKKTTSLKAKVKTGYIIFFLLTISPYLLSFGLEIINSKLNNYYINLPNDHKLKLIQSWKLDKNENIHTIEQFDNWFKSHITPVRLHPIILSFGIIFIMIILLKRWGYLLASFYAITLTIVSLSGTIKPNAVCPNKMTAIYTFCVNFAFCCYLFSKNIRRTFFPKDDQSELLNNKNNGL